MKAIIIILTLVTGLSLNAKAEKTKTGEHKSATAMSLTMQQEMELLKEYFPDLNPDEYSMETIQIYNSSFELIIEGEMNSMGEVENEELEKYLLSSNFLMSVDDKSLYMLEK